MNLQECADKLYQWFLETVRRHKYEFNDCIYVDDDCVKMSLFTDTNHYSITAKPPHDGYEGYLGCTMTSRKPRAGEDWHRGNDCLDGPFTKEIWLGILGDIIAMELVDIKRPISELYQTKRTLKIIDDLIKKTESGELPNVEVSTVFNPEDYE